MPKLSDAVRSRIRVTLGITESELDEVVDIVGGTALRAFSDFLERKLIGNHIPE